MFFKGKKILIIGGTGTIGRSLLKKILLEKPEVVRVFSRDEHKQYSLQNQLGKRTDIRYLIGDVRDFDRVHSAMQNIDFVFHTAAMKHVPACEYNPFEAVLTNIIGTQNVIKASIAQNVKKVVFTSTDKAISPTNTYGATKLTAERLISAAQYNKGTGNTIFASVRFGNVLRSRGSVIPLFIKQITEGKSVTVTDQNMSRFMMTLNQATSLLIKALQESKGGEVFVLKMPVINIRDLVHAVTDEVCNKYNIKKNTVDIQEIGLRTGEKMYEELMTIEESAIAWELPDMFIIPGMYSKCQTYPNAKRCSLGTYSSENQVPISFEEVRKMIIENNLI
ncbi:polysaccharide biosynthesis protein [Cytobacillus firmus]|uniref:polysaccharide biosynthesis protein n=1 Tax=Cytobacillus firmus TaxID=1399 RepID=UPI0018CD92C3|nr:membrane protein [Cytobacillus firmus]